MSTKHRIFSYSYSYSLLFLLILTQVSWARANPQADPVDLLAGAKWLCSTDEGKTFSAKPPEIKAGSVVHVVARTEFSAAEPAGLVVLELTHALPTRLWRNMKSLKFFLNDKPIKLPMQGMNYKTIPAISAKMLKKGRNVLTARMTLSNRRRKGKAWDYKLAICMRLAALKAGHLKIQTGPILGAIGEDFFTVTCRTNMPARAIALFGIGSDKPKPSRYGLIHRLKIPTTRHNPTTRPAKEIVKLGSPPIKLVRFNN